MIKHSGPISGVATYVNKYIATAGYDNQVILWDANSHRSLARGLHDHLANSCAFSSCGNYLASASSDYTVRVWKLPEMKLHSVFNKAEDDIEMVAFHPKRDLLAACSRDQNIYVFTIDGNLLHTFRGHTADVISVVWNREGTELISSSDDGSVKRWNLAKKKLVADLPLSDTETDTLIITEDGQIVAGDDYGNLILIRASRTEPQKFKAHSAGIKRLIYHSASQQIVSLSYDRTFTIWRMGDTLHLLDRGEFPALIWPRSCSFLSANTLVFGTFGDQYATYDLTQKTWHTNQIGETHGINRMWLRNADLFSTGDAGTIRMNGKEVYNAHSLCNFVFHVGENIFAGGQMGELFNLNQNQVVYTHNSPMNCTAVTSEKVFIGTYTGEVLVFRKTGDSNLVYEHQWKAHENAIKGLAISSNLVFSVCATGDVNFHDLQNYKPLDSKIRTHDKIANDCTHIQGDLFASVSRDLTLRLWSPQKVETFLSPHQHSIKCLAASEDGRYVCTGAYDGHIAIFDVKEKKWISKERISSKGISSLLFSSISKSFLASSYDGLITQVLVPAVSWKTEDAV